MGANLKEVRGRITSVKSTQQITKAMKMVSAAKLKKAQDAITNLRPYALKLDEILKNIMSNLDGDSGLAYNKLRSSTNVLIIPIASNRGLAGAFNTNVNKELTSLVESKYKEEWKAGNITIAPIGKKSNDFAIRHYGESTRVVGEHVALFDDLGFDNISKLADVVMERFKEARYDRVEVVYTKFKNAAMQFAIAEQFLPVPPLEIDENAVKTTHKADYIFEPNKEELLEQLIPSILQVNFQRYLLDSHASEHGARMTAMDKATENAEEIVKDLKIMYNKARQEAITNEISEIVGGAAALEGA